MASAPRARDTTSEKSVPETDSRTAAATTCIDRIGNPWGDLTPFSAPEDWAVRIDSCLDPGTDPASVDRWVPAACVLCSTGCGIDLAVKDNRLVGVRGRAEDRINRGRLGPKGLYGWQANRAGDRLSRPLVRDDTGRLHPVDWAVAMERIVAKSRALLKQDGPRSHAFYNSGQLFLEECYTIAVIAKAGLGTPHTDGNTRLCTATAGQSLKETFGADGQPGCFDDFNHADTIFLVGHNVAETQTVLWMRIRDRLAAPDPPTLIVVDPRTTVCARAAEIHLAPKLGTNLALLNAILHELITSQLIDKPFVEQHTVGFDELAKTVADMPVERAAEICGLNAADIRRAARLIGRARALVSTCLQGVYQSHQATASAVQVNNIHLLRGMVGQPGCAVFQMNGQPTAQNTRETGADGDMPGFRNWQNPAHMAELARLWNVPVLQIPHWGPPTHAMEIFHAAETGNIKFLWIIGTNPAVSLPHLQRVRDTLNQNRLFVVVQDAFLTETAHYADVVLPTALWGEKTGTFTNADRTVHLAEQAIEPPGEARSDLEILIDYARRMDFRDQRGGPLPPWTNPEEAFEAWKACSKGRPCDYSGMSYSLLRSHSGIHWPYPDGATAEQLRLYVDLHFATDVDVCEDFGHDLLTGANLEDKDFRARQAEGRAILKACSYVQSVERPDQTYPYQFTTGRTVYQFHTRTKTGRTQPLDDAAPDVWIEISAHDAQDEGLIEGDRVEVVSARGCMEASVRVVDIRPGVIFAPFHYGYWDLDAEDAADPKRAANEVTRAVWDSVSKQPLFKVSAVNLRKLSSDSDDPVGAGTPVKVSR